MTRWLLSLLSCIELPFHAVRQHVDASQPARVSHRGSLRAVQTQQQRGTVPTPLDLSKTRAAFKCMPRLTHTLLYASVRRGHVILQVSFVRVS